MRFSAGVLISFAGFLLMYVHYGTQSIPLKSITVVAFAVLCIFSAIYVIAEFMEHWGE